MTTAAGTPTKPRTEAQQIITRLQFSGMKRAEIAKQLGTSTDVLKHIMSGHTTGDAYLLALRSLNRFDPRAAGRPTEATVSAAPSHERGAGNGTSHGPASDAAPELQAAAPAIDAEQAPKDERSAGQRFKDAMKAQLTGHAHDSARVQLSTATKRAGSGNGVNNDDLVDQLVPLLALASVILTQLIIPERYSAVGPTHEESSAILRPLVRMMTRQLEVAGQLTETQLDVLAALAALGLYADRAWHTYKQIRATERGGRVVDEYPNERANGRGAGNGRAAHADARNAGDHSGYAAPAAANPLGRDYAPVSVAPGGQAPGSSFGGGSQAGGQAGYNPAADANHRQNGRPVPGGGSESVGHQPDPFASLYAADAAGRRQLGIN